MMRTWCVSISGSKRKRKDNWNKCNYFDGYHDSDTTFLPAPSGGKAYTPYGGARLKLHPEGADLCMMVFLSGIIEFSGWLSPRIHILQEMDHAGEGGETCSSCTVVHCTDSVGGAYSAYAKTLNAPFSG
ncbi:hypothetical protein TRIP_B250396 [uncultured Desulfatiglans sp.]|nr:hypothetical protein TRIP_B250396 [uncultured Desulfatiglans sp.]